MFTGLVEEVGEVLEFRRTAEGGVLKIRTSLKDIKLGDSVSVNGACLTAVELGDGYVVFELSPETIDRTNLKTLKRGDRVNLERSLRADSRLGGHFVLGHVDFVAPIRSFRSLGTHRELRIEVPSDYLKLFVEKGSVALDGISLTVNYIEGGEISINVIPHTYENTNLKYRKAGDLLNVEGDIIGKYVLRHLSGREESLRKKLEGLF